MRQLLLPKFLLPVRPANVVIEDHAVVLNGSRIEAVLPADDAKRQFPDAREVALPSHALMPGLMNMHTHSPMALMRGLADDLALDEWLKEHIWPTENRWVSPEFVYEGTELAMVEMLRCGTTCFNDMYFFPDQVAAAAEAVGMRAGIGMPVISIKTPWASGLDECLEKARDVHAGLQGKELLTPTLAPHAPYTVDDAALREVRALSSDTGMPIYMHVLEAEWEISHSRREFDKGVLERLGNLGLLGPGFMAVHMVHLDNHDIDVLAETDTQIVHCPESNLKLSNGIGRMADCLAAGINVSIGTDGAASNNDLDILGETRTAALVAKGASGDPTALNARTALEMVTINGARALGLDSEVGSVEPGKLADLAAIDLDQPETQPLYDVVSQIIYSASRRQFTDVWVNGRQLMAKGELTTIDQDRVMAQTQTWRQRMAEQT